MGEPKAHQRILVAKRTAALQFFGVDGHKRIAQHLPEKTRKETIDVALFSETWVPERWILDWHEAEWKAVGENRERFLKFCDAVVDQGFGKVRRVLIKLVTPALMASRAAELWSDEHDSGRLEAHVEKQRAELRLSDHPYVHSKLAGMVMAESMRYAGSLSARASALRAQHETRGNELVVTLTWA
jgi:hypothetical protein